jgi:hypothetical protein
MIYGRIRFDGSGALLDARTVGLAYRKTGFGGSGAVARALPPLYGWSPDIIRQATKHG